MPEQPNNRTETTTCLSCGKQFEAAVCTAAIFGQPFTIRQEHCDSCVADYDSRLAEMTGGHPDRQRTPWAEICPKVYQGFDEDKLPCDASRRAAHQVFQWNKGPRGIGLIGASRLGKTYIIHELFRRYYASGESIYMLTSTEFAYLCGLPDKRNAMIDRCIAVDMLYIDDLGKEKITDRVEADFFHVLEHRRRNLLPMFTAVNSAGDQLKRQMSADAGDPIVNRLRYDLCDFLAIESN